MIKTVFQLAAVDIFDQMGETAIYKPLSGPQVPACKVLITKEIDLQPVGMESSTWQRTVMLECLSAEVGREPDRGDRFEVGDDVYKVEKVLEQSDDLGIIISMIVRKINT